MYFPAPKIKRKLEWVDWEHKKLKNLPSGIWWLTNYLISDKSLQIVTVSNLFNQGWSILIG